MLVPEIAAAACPCDFITRTPSFADRFVACDTDFMRYGAGYFTSSNGASMLARITHPKNGSHDDWLLSVGDNAQKNFPNCSITHRKVGKRKSRIIKRDTQQVVNLTDAEWNACIVEMEILASAAASVTSLINYVGETPDRCKDVGSGYREVLCDGNEPPGTTCDHCEAATNSCDPINTLTTYGASTNGDRNYDWVAEDVDR